MYESEMTGKLYLLIKDKEFKDKRRSKGDEKAHLMCVWRRCTTFRQGFIECASGLFMIF